MFPVCITRGLHGKTHTQQKKFFKEKRHSSHLHVTHSYPTTYSVTSCILNSSHINIFSHNMV